MQADRTSQSRCAAGDDATGRNQTRAALGTVRIMAAVTETEARVVTDYVESQLHDAEDGVSLVQRVEQRRIMGHVHEIFDVHTIKGRWWVITNPTNLYAQEDFPDREMALTYHLGLAIQLSERGRVETDSDRQEVARGAWRRYTQVVEAMDSAGDAEDFQAVGVKCREALLAIVREHRGANWVGDVAEPPKGDDFKGWMGIFASRLLGERRQRAYLKDTADRTWDIAVGLQHKSDATPWDAELVLDAVGTLLGTFMIARMMHEQGAPPRCPRCGSYRYSDTVVRATSEDGEDGLATFAECAACGHRQDEHFEPF